MKKFLITAITILTLHCSFGQAPKRDIEKADDALYAEVFDEAYELYNELSQKYPNDDSFKYHQLIAYHLSEGRGTDISGLLAFEKEMGAKDRFYNYWLGRIRFMRYEFEIALDHFRAFIKINRYTTSSLLEESRYMIRWAQRAQKFYQAIDDYEITQLPAGINTSANEVAPVFFKGHDELIYFQSQEDETYKAMHAIKTGEDWDTAEEITTFGTFEQSELRAEILSDEKTLVVFKTKNGGDLFTSNYSSGAWSELKEYDPSLVAKIKSDFFISNDEQTILFSSRRGNKDFDIFEINKTQNGWSDPKPLNINTDGYDEDFPYITDDGKTLYFSSNRPESIGGYDVFISTKNSGGLWSQPKNMGFPINTIDHDVHFQMSHGSNTGYFSTDRLRSEGGLDVFYFFKIEFKGASGIVTNAKTEEPIPNVQVKFRPVLYTDEVIEADTDEAGKYSATLIKNEEFIVEFYVNRQLLDEKSVMITEETNSLNFAITVKDSIAELTDFVSLYKGDTSKIEIEEVKKEMQTKLPMTKPIYFDLELADIKTEYVSSLSKLALALKADRKIIIKVNGYADNTGATAYNNKLSTKRAQSVADYLISKGVNKSQIIVKGFGEDKPIATNDTEEGRAKNRRVEFDF
ncbi:MAG: OmpA family protein [Cyclobacteriaceae bacterium]